MSHRHMSRPHTNTVEWIVCERTSRWASALRMALANVERPFRLRELRHLMELDAELTARPTSIVAAEVRRDNFAELLAWLTAARQCHVHARTVALLDRSIDDHLEQVRDALVEVGADAIAASPRRLSAVIALAARHAEVPGKAAENTSVLASAWASLPWQAV